MKSVIQKGEEARHLMPRLQQNVLETTYQRSLATLMLEAGTVTPPRQTPYEMDSDENIYEDVSPVLRVIIMDSLYIIRGQSTM